MRFQGREIVYKVMKTYFTIHVGNKLHNYRKNLFLWLMQSLFSEITLIWPFDITMVINVTRIIYYNCSYCDHSTQEKLNLALRHHFVQQDCLVYLLTFVIRNQWIRINIFHIIHWLSLFLFLSCSKPRWKTWLQLSLYSSANINRC